MFGNQNGFGDSGSGFINSQSDATTPRRSQVTNIMPCTVAQLTLAQQIDDKFFHDNIELRQVSLLGIVRAASESNTNICYELDDYSGMLIEVKLFVDNDENTPTDNHTKMLPTGIYVHVIGHLRSFGGKRMVTAFKIDQITDFNELTCHLAEVVHAHMYHNKKPEVNSTGRSSEDMSRRLADEGPVVASDQGLTNQQQQVLNIIRRSMEDVGMNVEVIYDQLKGMPRKVIEGAIEFLSSEGHVYSTIDDFHFKATDVY